MPEPVRFPSFEIRTIGLSTVGDPVAALASALGAAPAAYVRITRGLVSRFLFVHDGKTHTAGTLDDGRVSSTTCEDFLTALGAATAAEACVIDLPLFLCASVAFRKPPARRIPASLLGGKSVLAAVRELAKDSVLVLRSSEVWNFVYCDRGEPVRLYAAAGEVVPAEEPIANQIGALVRAHRDCTVDLYDDVRLPPSSDAGRPLTSYGAAPRLTIVEEARVEEPKPCLLVRLEGREVFRYPLTGTPIRIGRGAEKEITLDGASVSRDHAEIIREGDHWLVRDLGSVNGVMVKGARVGMLRLTPGTEIGIGVYTIVYGLDSARDEVPPIPDPPPPVVSERRGPTIMLAGNELGVIEYRGIRHEMRSPLFFIGTGMDAHLKLDGSDVAARHAMIIREPSGGFRISSRDSQELILNGERISDRFLRSGDEIRIGAHTLRFLIETASAIRKL